MGPAQAPHTRQHLCQTTQGRLAAMGGSVGVDYGQLRLGGDELLVGEALQQRRIVEGDTGYGVVRVPASHRLLEPAAQVTLGVVEQCQLDGHDGRRLAWAGVCVTFHRMKAIVVDTETPERDLLWRDVADPVAGDGQVLVDIHASAVNRADLLQRGGHYPPPPGESDILGLEMAGVVAATGLGVSGWQVGDRVCALLGGGGYAEQVAVDARQLLPVPDGWSFERAAAVPEVFLTAWLNLFREAGLRASETVLIHAGASGVGTAAIQLAREAGCRVVVTAGTEAKRERCRQLGAAFACDYKDTDFAAEIRAYLNDDLAQHRGDGAAISPNANGGGVNVVLDVGGASHLARNLDVLAPQGRLVLLALLGGSDSGIDLGLVLRKRLHLIGSTLRSRPIPEKGDIIAGFRAQFWDALVAGRIEPVIDRVIPVQEAGAAHAVIAGNTTIGKVILAVRRT